MPLVEKQDVFPWVEQVIGGKIVDSERQGGRESGGRPGWFLNCDIAGRNERFYVRGSRGDEFGFTKIYSLERETEVMKVLHDQGIPVPKIIDHSKNPDATLMEYVAGENDFTLIKSIEERNAVADDFARIMADWHKIDASKFKKAGLEAPVSREDYVLNDLAVWEKGCLPYLKEPVPIVTFTCKWLRENIPNAPERPVLVQGDTGPGQFIFANSKVASVVDWELAFLGDPMRELAQIRTRDVWYPTGNLTYWFSQYSQYSGVELDYPRLRYYSVFAMFITTLALCPYVQQPNPRDEHAEWFAQDVWSKKATAEALAESLGLELEPVVLPEFELSRHAQLFDMLVDNLEAEQLPHIEDSFLQHRMNMLLRLVSYIRNTEHFGTEINAIELDDISQLLGKKQQSYAEAMRSLNTYCEQAEAKDYESLVRYFYRHACREEALMAGAMGRAANASMSPIQ